MTNISVIQLLQFFVLDKLELSSKVIPQGLFPRVRSFDQEILRLAIETVSSHRGGDTFFCGRQVIDIYCNIYTHTVSLCMCQFVINFFLLVSVLIVPHQSKHGRVQ